MLFLYVTSLTVVPYLIPLSADTYIGSSPSPRGPKTTPIPRRRSSRSGRLSKTPHTRSAAQKMGLSATEYRRPADLLRLSRKYRRQALQATTKAEDLEDRARRITAEEKDVSDMATTDEEASMDGTEG